MSKEAYKRVQKIGEDNLQIKIAFKNESRFMKILSKILFFNKRFMEDFTTVIGNTIYFPSRKWLENRYGETVVTLFHEYTHIADSKKISKILFSLSYLFPQWLSIFALLGFLTPYAFLFLVFLLPLPAPFRAFWEIRGYEITDLLYYKLTGNFVANPKQFTGSNYYFMFPRKKFIQKLLNDNREKIKTSGHGMFVKNSNSYLAILNIDN